MSCPPKSSLALSDICMHCCCPTPCASRRFPCDPCTRLRYQSPDQLAVTLRTHAVSKRTTPQQQTPPWPPTNNARRRAKGPCSTNPLHLVQAATHAPCLALTSVRTALCSHTSKAPVGGNQGPQSSGLQVNLQLITREKPRHTCNLAYTTMVCMALVK
jgi:hypothetical protein